MPLEKAGGLFVDEFLSEKEQIEEIRGWWRENGWYLIGGAILGIAALLGWNRYGVYQDTQGEAASALYVELRQAATDDAPGDARTLLAQLRENHPSSPYTDQAGLLVAVLRMRAGDHGHLGVDQGLRQRHLRGHGAFGYLFLGAGGARNAEDVPDRKDAPVAR